MRPCLPARDDAEPAWSASGRASSAWRTRVRWAGRPSAMERCMPTSKVRTLSWRPRAPAGSRSSIAPAMPEASRCPRSPPAARSRRAAAQQRDGVFLAAGFQAGGNVAQPLAAGNPGRVQERGQADQLRGLGQPGCAQPAGVQRRQPGPAGQRGGQRIGDVPTRRAGAAGEQVLAGERRGFQQPVVLAGQHRHRPPALAFINEWPDDVQVRSGPCCQRRPLQELRSDPRHRLEPVPKVLTAQRCMRVSSGG